LPVNTIADSGTLSSSPIEAESSPDWHLTGLLTHASTNLNSLPEATLSGRSIHSTFSSQRIQLRGSGGFAPHFPNARCLILHPFANRVSSNATTGERGELPLVASIRRV